MKKSVTIYTDGACRNNPGPGGWAAIIQCDGSETEIFGCEEHTTNNRMELMAAIESLEYLDASSIVEIYTDSKYVKDGITRWIAGWLKNNWRTSDKKPVKNQELWQRLLEATKRHEISWHWVEGHSGHEHNEKVDKLARSQCQLERPPVPEKNK